MIIKASVDSLASLACVIPEKDLLKLWVMFYSIKFYYVSYNFKWYGILNVRLFHAWDFILKIIFIIEILGMTIKLVPYLKNDSRVSEFQLPNQGTSTIKILTSSKCIPDCHRPFRSRCPCCHRSCSHIVFRVRNLFRDSSELNRNSYLISIILASKHLHL